MHQIFCNQLVQWNSVTFSSHKLSNFHIPWNSVTFSSHELSHIFIPWNSVTFSSSIKLTRWIDLMICTNYSRPNSYSHSFHPMKFSHIFIPVKFSHIHIPKNSVSILFLWYGQTILIQTTALTDFIQWHLVTSSSHETQSHLYPISFSRYTYIIIFTNYLKPNNCTCCFHPMTFGHIHMPMKFSHIHIPWN